MDYNGENIIQITKEYGYDGGAFYSPKVIGLFGESINPRRKANGKITLTKKFIESFL